MAGAPFQMMGPVDEEKWGLFNPEEKILQAFNVWLLMGNLPSAGGFWDQPESVRQDLMTLLWRYSIKAATLPRQ